MPKTVSNSNVAGVAQRAFSGLPVAQQLLADRILPEDAATWGIGYLDADSEAPELSARITIPVADEKQQVVFIAGRATRPEQSPKYINWPYGVKASQYLYGLHAAIPAIREGGHAIVVEGFFDVICLHRLGYRQTVGILGSRIKDFQAFLLACYAPKAIVVADPDDAGIKGADATAFSLSRYGVHAITTAYRNESGSDVADLCRSNPDIVRRMLRDAGWKINIDCQADTGELSLAQAHSAPLSG